MNDGRKVPRDIQEYIRILVAQRVVDKNEKPTKLATEFKVSYMAVYNWCKIYREKGIESLKSKKASGRKPKLNDKQKKSIRKFIVGSDPRQYGFDFGLWTRKIICELILQKYNITISITTAGRLLEELELTPRKPLERAYQQNPELVSEWKNKTHPDIKFF